MHAEQVLINTANVTLFSIKMKCISVPASNHCFELIYLFWSYGFRQLFWTMSDWNAESRI